MGDITEFPGDHQDPYKTTKQFQYSVPVTQPYQTISPYISSFPPRIHRESSKTDDGAWAFRRDWLASGGRFDKIASVNPISGNFVALTIPEALPDRLFSLAYLTEYFTLYDDLVDKAGETDEADLESAYFWDASNLQGGKLHQVQNVERRNVLARISYEILKIDKVLGQDLLDCFAAKAITLKATLPSRVIVPNSVDEYLRMRVEDAQVETGMVMNRFGIGLTLSKEEQQSVAHITDRLYEAIVLANDYYSWDVEYEYYLQQGQSVPLVNAIFFITQWQSVGIPRAKKLLKAKIRALEKKYSFLKNRYVVETVCSPTILGWFALLEQATAGNALWSASTTRYHSSATPPLPPTLSSGLQERESLTSMCNDKQSRVKFCENAGDCNVEVPPELANEDNGPCLRCKALIDEKTVLEPYEYLSSLPSKGVRSLAITSLNIWYHAPVDKAQLVQDIVDLMHQSSLMVDDIEDGSTLRRGQPATHMIYGLGRTINTANYLLVKTYQMAPQFAEGAASHMSDELQQICIGQGHDLLWTHNCQLPTEEEYMVMVERKTGGFFRIVSKLMRGEATTNKDLNTDDLMSLLGQYFQIRDDYSNLTSAEYTAQKGFCEDLDEGKFSLLLIHALTHTNDTQLHSILQGRKMNGGMTYEMKKLVLKRMEEAGTFEYTRRLLGGMYERLLGMVGEIELVTGVENWVLRGLLLKLEI